MDNQTKRRGDRRKDYVTVLAIVLFVFIVILELMLVTWLPRQLLSEALWRRDVAIAELIDLEDMLRTNIKHTLKFKSKWDDGESKMALDCLNDIAKYLRQYQTKMTKEQIRQLYLMLTKFETRYNQWKDMRYCNNQETINIQPILEITQDRYKNDANRKSETKDNNILFQD